VIGNQLSTTEPKTDERWKFLRDVVVFQLDASGLPARLVVDGLGAFDRRP